MALGNLTYTGWGSVVDQAVQALAGTGGLIAREVQPAPVLLERQAQVTRLVTSWNADLADSIAAMNLFRDEAKGTSPGGDRAARDPSRGQLWS